MVENDTDVTKTRAVLDRSGEQFANLLQGVSDAGTPVPGCDWNVGEVAAHVVLATEAYVGLAGGGSEPYVDVTDVAGGSVASSNAARIAAEPDRDLRSLTDRLRTANRAVLDAAEGRPASDPVVWNGQQLTLGELLGILIGEQLLHGRDIAKATSQRWVIDKDDARVVLASLVGLLPLLVDPEATANVDVSYDIHIRGGARVTLHIDHGEGTVTAKNGSADCHVSADPVAMLLVSYGRRSQWGPALTGKLVAWGRKPWLGLRLTHYLATP